MFELITRGSSTSKTRDLGRLVLPLLLLGACALPEIETKDEQAADLDAVLFFEDAVARGWLSGTGEVIAELVTNDMVHDPLASLRVSTDGGSWVDRDGNSRRLTIDPAAGDEQGVTLLGRLPTTAEDGAIELYMMWSQLDADIAYDECSARTRTSKPCERSGRSICCEYEQYCTNGNRCDVGDGSGMTYECLDRRTSFDCSDIVDDGGGGGGGHSCGCSGECGGGCCI